MARTVTGKHSQPLNNPARKTQLLQDCHDLKFDMNLDDICSSRQYIRIGTLCADYDAGCSHPETSSCPTAARDSIGTALYISSRTVGTSGESPFLLLVNHVYNKDQLHGVSGQQLLHHVSDIYKSCLLSHPVCLVDDAGNDALSE